MTVETRQWQGIIGQTCMLILRSTWHPDFTTRRSPRHQLSTGTTCLKIASCSHRNLEKVATEAACYVLCSHDENLTKASAYFDKILAEEMDHSTALFGAGVIGAAAGELLAVQKALHFPTQYGKFKHLVRLHGASCSGERVEFHKLFQKYKTEIAVSAATAGIRGLPILIWLARSPSRGFPNRSGSTPAFWTEEIPAAAAASGSLENLLFLRRQDYLCPWNLASCAQTICSTLAWQALQTDIHSAGTYAYVSAALWALAAQLQDAAVLQQLKAAGECYPCDAEACHILLQTGAVDVLTWVLHNHGRDQDVAASKLFRQCVDAALHDDHAADLRWLRSISPAKCWQQHGLYSSATSQLTRQLLRSVAFSSPCTARDWANAAKQQSTEELQLLFSTAMPNDAHWDESICKAAAVGGHLEVCAWLWGRVPAAFWDKACAHALAADRPHVIRWLLHKDPPCPFQPILPPSPWAPAGSSGTKNDLGWTVLGCYSRLPSPELLAQIPMDPYACRQAAANNNMELMVYLREKGCPWDARSCSLAAGNGHTQMLRWLRSQNPPCPWAAHSAQLAAENDHLDTLFWLLSQQPACPFPSRPEAASDRCLQHLIVMGCPMPSPAARTRARAVCPLPASLVLGLIKWYEKVGAQGSASFRLAEQAPRDDLLAHLSSLDPDLLWHICHLAGLCAQ